MLQKIDRRGWTVVASVALVTALAATLGFATAQDRERPGARSAAELAAERVPETTAGQAAALADGVITAFEYEEAVGQTVACLAARGFEVGEPRRLDNGNLSIQFASSDIDEGRRYQAAYQDCYVQNQRDIDLVWAAARAESQPRPAEDVVSASRAALAGCLRGRGVTAAEDGDALLLMLDRVARAGYQSDVFYQCAGEALKANGVLPEQ